MKEYVYQPRSECDCPYASCEVTGLCLAVRIAELEAALRDIARWRQEDQDDVEIAILQWRGCVAIARGALGITDVTP